ncbi:hypothetical protein FDECE_3476 [Fusarium decemcellulare]|nr:hypothetical protein FDECE_3476 [Fusarium decemcellulare]
MSEASLESSSRSSFSAIDAIIDAIFERNATWPKKMKDEGFIVVFVGIDIDKFEKDKRISESDGVYLVLCFSTPEGSDILEPPHKELFLEQLRENEWKDESKRELVFKDSGIILNVSPYSHEVTRADINRISCKKPEAVKNPQADDWLTRVVGYDMDDVNLIACTIEQESLRVIAEIGDDVEVFKFEHAEL